MWYDISMAAKKTTLKGIIFVLVLIVLAMGYSMYTTSSKNSKETYTRVDSVEENTTPASPDTDTTPNPPQKMEEAFIEEETTPVVAEDSCEKDLIAKLKADKTEYKKGRILVGFKQGISFSGAQAVSKKYELVQVIAGVDEDSYNSMRLLTVNVPTGREPYFVCYLKSNSSIRYTNVNVLLFTKPI